MTGAETHVKLPRGVVRGALAAILIVAAVVRFWDIGGQGPYLFDDAYYALEARWMHDFVDTVLGSVRLLGEERRTGEDLWKMEDQFAAFKAALERHPVLVLEPPIRPIYVARPLHVTSIALVMLVAGPVPWAGAFVAATMSLLTVPLVFRIGRRYFGEIAGLAAAAALALSGYHLLYARKGFAEAGSVLFLTLAFGLYLRSREAGCSLIARRWWVFGAGVAWGLGVTVHDRWLLMLAIPVLVELGSLVSRDRQSFVELVRRGAIVGVGLLLPILAIELAHHVAMVLCNMMGFSYPVPTYLVQLASHIPLAIAGQELGQIEGASPMNALTYPYLFWTLEGPVWCALALVGVAVCTLRRGAVGWTLLTWLALPCVYYGFTRAAARYGSITIPAAAILVGVGVAAIARRREPLGGLSPRAATAGACAALVAVGGWMASVQVRGATSGYGPAMAYVSERGDGRVVSTATYNTMTYVGMDRSALPPERFEDLRALYDAGYRYCLVDFYLYYITVMLEGTVGRGLAEPENVARMKASGLYDKVAETMAMWRARAATLARVEAEAPRVATFPNPFGTNPGDVFEINTSFAATLSYLDAPPDGADEIRLYDLAPLFENGTAP